ncbi:hypothetical protein EON68_02120, partial [archaeon]
MSKRGASHASAAAAAVTSVAARKPEVQQDESDSGIAAAFADVTLFKTEPVVAEVESASGTIVHTLALATICAISFFIRLFAVVRWESVIHEFVRRLANACARARMHTHAQGLPPPPASACRIRTSISARPSTCRKRV